MSAKLHRITSHKTVILIVTSVLAFSGNGIDISVLVSYFLGTAIVNDLLLPLSLTEVHKPCICIPQMMCYIILYASLHYRKILYSGFPQSWHISFVWRWGCYLQPDCDQCAIKEVCPSWYIFFCSVCMWVISDVLCMVAAPYSASYGWIQIPCVSLVALLLLSLRCTVFVMSVVV